MLVMVCCQGGVDAVRHVTFSLVWCIGISLLGPCPFSLCFWLAPSGLFAEKHRVVCPVTHEKQRVGFVCVGLMLAKERGKDRLFIGLCYWIWSPWVIIMVSLLIHLS